ncbi:enoyl-CoA hydratase/isomerase family protein [Amycolatopsis rhizosphaerae]|uniref:Enoyl-CoA hydratase/isomerase family protein n=1 Tax=Amycolatopsis rhizosphaerae TaxID=2053003 RepID=A0A558D5P0_9PSEU|nr:enoyl-CoA hydratase/isomerase family protein [Amycolatopsis rhizosphaerae]TVT56322.1 enoyl-CoA hydratase/isomerase family protein [Amycolatopsis rhizosphaerae]
MTEVEVVGGVAVVRLAHGKVNALDTELCRAIERTMRELDGREGVRSVVVTGAGRAFSAGVDLRRVVDGGAAYVAEFLPALSGAFRAVFDLGKPVVAAVNGHAIAGGCVLAAACDHRIMATGTGVVGVPELRVGVPFPETALEIMRFTLGPVRARQTIFDGTNHDPEAALALGLVDELCAPDALLDRAVAVAEELATAFPADTFRYTKAQVRREVHERLDGLTESELGALWTAAATDGRIQAFLDRTIGSGGSRNQG